MSDLPSITTTDAKALAEGRHRNLGNPLIGWVVYVSDLQTTGFVSMYVTDGTTNLKVGRGGKRRRPPNQQAMRWVDVSTLVPCEP